MDYYQKTASESLSRLDSSKQGISSQEATKRLQKYGPNIISPKKTPLWKIIIEPFNSVFIYVLFVAAALSFAHEANIDGIIIIVIIMISAVIYYVQTYSTTRILNSLKKHTKQKVTVMRGGHEIIIESSHIVPGDIVVLEEGDKIPADGRVIESRSLRVDESQLTGESLPISKTPEKLSGNKAIYEQVNMVFQGSFAVGGSALVLVTLTGNSTEFGKIAALSVEERSESPVQAKIDSLIVKVIIAVGIISLGIFALSLYRGMDFTEALRFVIALAVSAVPEGLPVAISVILAVGMSRMAARKALVRKMAAIESIGTITTIATDKTGTLTKNKLSVTEVWHSDGSSRTKKTLAMSALATNTKVFDPLDQAFKDYISKENIKTGNNPPVREYKFEHSIAMSGNIWHHGDDYVMYIKGSPEAIMNHSDLTENEREELTHKLHAFAASGFRVIALASTRINSVPESISNVPKSKKFDFDGFVAVADIIRPEAKSAIRTATEAGITVRMVTGDHFETAYQIGRELGLVESRDQVFDSSKMDLLSEDELDKIVDKTRVFSRVVPEQKHRLLSILKKNNITAMTGDGVNDVPALTNAHIGLAMGSGAEIAKDGADIVLLDNNFRSIVSAVHEGRTIFANIKRMVAYLISTNLGEVLVSAAALIVGMPLPLVPIQILWINIVTDSFMVIPLGLEPGEKRNMKHPPQKIGAPLLSKFMISRIVVIAITTAIVVFWLYSEFLSQHDVAYARTIAFSALATIQWASALCMRSDYEPIYYRFFRWNPAILIGLGIGVALHLLVLFGPLGSLLHVSSVLIGDLIYSSAIAFFAPIVVIETHKWIGRRFFNKGSRKYSINPKR